MRVLVAAALVLACLAVFLMRYRTPQAERVEPVAPVHQVEAQAPGAESIRAPALERPSAAPPKTAGRLLAASPPATIETFQVDSPHFGTMDALVRTRQDAVDACRDRFKMPRLEELLRNSTVIGPPSGKRVREAAMQQNIVLQISCSDSWCVLEFAQVIDTWVEFPAPDGTLRRASLADAAVDGCVERALQGARLGSETNGSTKLERFWIQARAGEAVYDLP